MDSNRWTSLTALVLGLGLAAGISSVARADDESAGATKEEATDPTALDESYIASRAPEGIFPGAFRQVNAGLRYRF